MKKKTNPSPSNRSAEKRIGKAGAIATAMIVGASAMAQPKQEPEPMSMTRSMMASVERGQEDDARHRQALAPISLPEMDPKDRRAQDQTWLTFPEWFLVFSPEEMATAMEKGAAPSSLPWWRHGAQIWEAYATMAKRASQEGGGINWGYHAMVSVIAISTTVEYALRGAWEETIGRMFEFLREGLTPEDRLEIQEARRYVSFIKERPWYEFDFVSGIKALWKKTPPMDGKNTGRRWERKIKLTMEWSAKAAYGWLIGKATGAAYEKPLMTTVVDAHNAKGERRRFELPRYERFTSAAMNLAQQGWSFERVCGNSGPVVISLVRAQNDPQEMPAGVRELMRQDVPTSREERVVIETTVSQLSETLRALAARPRLRVEHVFDF